MNQLLGEVKQAVAHAFDVAYKLVSSEKKKNLKRNREIVQLLKTKNGFVFRVRNALRLTIADFPQDPATRTGMFKHHIIGTVINEVWFGRSDKEGPMFANIFNPDGKGIPVELIALILTAVRRPRCQATLISSRFGTAFSSGSRGGRGRSRFRRSSSRTRTTS